MPAVPLKSSSKTTAPQPAAAVQALLRFNTAAQIVAHQYRYPVLLFLASLAGFMLVRGIMTWSQSQEALLQWDATWYRSIIDHGYSTDGDPYIQHNVVFFPLYPMACRMVKTLLPVETSTAMLIVSAVCTLIGLILLYKVLLRHCSELIARAALALVAFNPFAAFLYNGYTESLFFLLISAFFYFLLNANRPWIAAAMAGLASAVRPYGCLLSFVLVFELLRQHHREYGFRLDFSSLFLRRILIWTPLCFVGLMAYTAWLGYTFGEPLAFSHNMRAWDSSAGLKETWSNLLTFKHVGTGLVFSLSTQPWTASFTTGLLLFLAAPVLLLTGFKKVHPAFSFFLLMMFLFLHIEGKNDALRLVNAGRHLLVVFPLVVLLASFFDPARVERFLASWTDTTSPAQPCMCWRLICALPLLGVIVLFAFLYLNNTARFYHGEFL